MLIFAKVKSTVSPDVNAVATLIMLAAALGLAPAMFFTRRRSDD